jgi:AcrR family transcriptional regulator
MDSIVNGARRYRGVPTKERQAQRRALLIEAAIQVYGQQGYRRATVKAVCEAAGLTERYFYESFANSEELLIASFNTVTYAAFDEILQAAQAAGKERMERARAMLYTYFDLLKRNPLSARVLLVEIQGVSPAVDQAFQVALQTIRERAALILAPPGWRPDRLLQAGVLGGVIQIALRWIAQGYEPPIDEVTNTALQLVRVLWRKPTKCIR